MDKNMIHIDDLVRQRLNGGEEEERPGAWLNMRDLLDQKMPVKPVPGGITNWRRLLGYTAGFLLLASLSVGGYEMTTAMKGHKGAGDAGKAAQGKTRTAINTSNAPYASPAATENAKQAKPVLASNDAIVAKHEASKSNAAATTPEKHSVSSHKHVNTPVQPNQEPLIASSAISKVSGGPSADEMPSENSDNTIITKTVSNNNNKTGSQDQNTTQKHKKAAGKVIAVHPQKNILNSGAIATTKAQHDEATETQHVTSTAKNSVSLVHKKVKHTEKQPKAAVNTTAISQVAAHKSHIPGNKSAASLIPASGVSSVNNTIVKKQISETQQKTQTATIDKLEVVQKMQINPVKQISTNSFDTLSISKISLDKSVQDRLTASNTGHVADKKELGEGSASKSNTDAKKDDKDSKGKLSKSSSRGSGIMQQFNEMIENFKYNFGHMEFTPGIIGGINSTFFGGSYSLKGFQIGVSGNWKMDEHWSFLTELKYMNRTSSNAVIYDNYIRRNTNTGGRDSVNRYFNLSNLQSVELPIALNYKTGRFNVFIGGSVLYNFAIDAAFVENPYALPDANGTISASKLSIDDFAARLGLTYMAGIAYQITPALQLDLRMSKMFWDNGKGSGSQIISNDLYKTPSLQLSIGYRFKQQDNKIK